MLNPIIALTSSLLTSLYDRPHRSHLNQHVTSLHDQFTHPCCGRSRLDHWLDEENRPWIEQLSLSGHIKLTAKLDNNAVTIKATLTSLGQKLLDWLER